MGNIFILYGKVFIETPRQDIPHGEDPGWRKMIAARDRRKVTGNCDDPHVAHLRGMAGDEFRSGHQWGGISAEKLCSTSGSNRVPEPS